MGNKYSRIKGKILKRLNKSNTSSNKSNKSPTVSTFDENMMINYHEGSSELKYKLPRKSDTLSHLQSPHYTLRYLWQSNFSSPVEEILSSSGVVLDAGCGFGVWLYDMALEYQTTDFVGVGLSPNQFPSSQMPKNVKFAQANILCGLPFEDNEFDFVRLSYFVHSLACSEWEPAIKELIRVTKSGGWVEFVEPDLVPINMGPKFTILMDALKQFVGERTDIIERLELILLSTNLLKNIHQDTKSLIIGQSGGEVGISHENSIKEYFMENSSQFYKRLGISHEEYVKLLNDVIKECQTRKVEVRFFRFWAQKIES